jgi:hypothetical protein
MNSRISHRARPWLLAAVVGIAGIANADSATRYCEIAMDFSVNGRPVAAPSTVVEFGKEAEITLSRDDGATGWQFRIVADEPTIVHRVNVIPISMDLFELINGQAVLRASPHFAVAPGQRADLDTQFGEDDGRKAHIGLVASLRADAGAETPASDANDEPR